MCLHFSAKNIIPGCILTRLNLPSTYMTLRSVSVRIFVRNQRSLFPLTPLRKGETKLTYVGMLIATMQYKRRRVGLALGFSSS